MNQTLTAVELTNTANIMSNLPFPEAAAMFRECIERHGPSTTVKIVKLAELYTRTKCGEIDRAEAAGLQADILNLEVTNGII